MVFFFTEKQQFLQAEGINRAIIDLLGTLLQEPHIPHLKALGGLSSLSLECEIWLLWALGLPQKTAGQQQLILESTSLLFSLLSWLQGLLSTQTKHPPAPLLSWNPLYTCRAEPWPCHHGVNLKLVFSRASRQRAAAPKGSWLCACHSLTGCQAAGSECPRRGCDKRQTIVPSFPLWLQGSSLLLLENGNQAPYLIPGTGSWSPRKGSYFVEGLPVQ